jgi:alkylation response protein AidB-like acyl-CoA dehydrogenase
MARQIEAAQAWIELLVYQTQEFKDYGKMNDRIGGVTALAKGHGSQICEFVLREASQIFGGLSYTRGGVGGKVERLYR